jgi:hypothetical protein
LIENIKNLTEGTIYSISTFKPKCVLVIGDRERRLILMRKEDALLYIDRI